MKFNKSSLSENKILELNEIISFDNVRDNILELKNINVNASIILLNSLIHIDFKIEGKIKVRSSYTLKPLDYNLKFKDEIDISEDEKNIDTIFIKGNEVDLNQTIYDLVVGHVPTRIVGKDEKCEVKGDGFSVISEKDLKENKNEERSSPFDVLKDYKI